MSESHQANDEFHQYTSTEMCDLVNTYLTAFVRDADNRKVCRLCALREMLCAVLLNAAYAEVGDGETVEDSRLNTVALTAAGLVIDSLNHNPGQFEEFDPTKTN